jgi:hypothetical protein
MTRYEDDKQSPRSMRRKTLPTALLEWPLWMRHEHLAGALGEQRQITHTPSRSHGIFPRPPAAVERVKMRPTGGREAMPLQRAVVVLQCRGQLACALDAAAIGHPHHLYAGVAKDGHHVLDILTACLRRNMRHHFGADTRGAIRDRAHAMEPDATGQATPGTGRRPGLAFEALWRFAVAWAHRACGQASALGTPPPAPSGQGNAPDQGCLCIEPEALALTRPGLQGGAWAMGLGQVSGVGRALAGRAAGASRVCLHANRPRSRPRWLPLWWANPVARARQLPWEEQAPSASGSGSTRRWRGGASAHVTGRGRPGRGRARKPWAPSVAKRWTHLLRAALGKWKVSEAAVTWWPTTTARTACARRKPRASLVCLRTGSRVARA